MNLLPYHLLVGVAYMKLTLESIKNIFRRLIFGFPQAKLPQNGELRGKVAIITGANRGIGFEIAKTFAKLGAIVIIGCRDLRLGREAAQRIDESRAAGDRARTTVFVLDLESFESVRAFARNIIRSVRRVDYLINNAGVMMCAEAKSVDGFERQLACNYLGPFLLTHLLLDRMINRDRLDAVAIEIEKLPPIQDQNDEQKRTKKEEGEKGNEEEEEELARVINVSSLSHNAGIMKFENINLHGIYTPTRAYAQSKLAVILWTRELAKRIPAIRAYVTDPGLARTGLFASTSLPFVRFLGRTMGPVGFADAQHGAQTMLHCALDRGECARESGNYYMACKRVRNITKRVNDRDAERLWTLSLRCCEKFLSP